MGAVTYIGKKGAQLVTHAVIATAAKGKGKQIEQARRERR